MVVDELNPGVKFGPRLSPSPHLQGAILTYEDDIYYLNGKLKWERWAKQIQIYRKGHIQLRIASDLGKTVEDKLNFKIAILSRDFLGLILCVILR